MATPGQTVVLTVTAEGAAPLSYQWRKDGVSLAEIGEVSGATTATLSNVLKLDASGYSLVLSNADGSVTSDGRSIRRRATRFPARRLPSKVPRQGVASAVGGNRAA